MHEPDVFIRVLKFLSQYKDDGKMYLIDEVMPGISNKERLVILSDLRQNGLIRYSDANYGVRLASQPRPRRNNSGIKAIITLKGIDYLQGSIHSPKNTTININGNNSNNNLAVDSSHVVFNNTTDISTAFLKMIDNLKSDNDFLAKEKEEVLEAMSEMHRELSAKGTVSKSKFYSFLSRFGDASTVGGFLLQVYESNKHIFA